MQERIKLISEIIGEHSHSINLQFSTEDCETIYSLCVEKNEIYYTKSMPEECGCCDRFEEFDSELDRFLEFMSEADFIDFIEHIKIKLGSA